MTLDQWTSLLVAVMLAVMMAATGLGVAVADLAAVGKDWRLVARAAVANYVCVPAVAVVLLVLFQAAPLVVAGFLILAACPGAPFGPPCTNLARGNRAAAVGLM